MRINKLISQNLTKEEYRKYYEALQFKYQFQLRGTHLKGQMYFDDWTEYYEEDIMKIVNKHKILGNLESSISLMRILFFDIYISLQYDDSINNNEHIKEYLTFIYNSDNINSQQLRLDLRSKVIHNVHTNKCHICGIQFVQPSYTCICEICELTHRDVSYLTEHGFDCPVCGKKLPLSEDPYF